MHLNGPLYTPAALPAGKVPVTHWAPEPVTTFWNTEKYHATANCRFPMLSWFVSLHVAAEPFIKHKPLSRCSYAVYVVRIIHVFSYSNFIVWLHTAR